MKRILAGALLLACLAAGAAADEIRVFAAEGTMDERTASRLVQLLGREFPQAQWTLEHESQTKEALWELVMEDRAPQIAICSPAPVSLWEAEGLLLPLTKHIGGQKNIAPAVLAACTQGEELFMAPLAARHRQMAVNRRMMEKRHLGYLLNPVEHPAWLTSQLYQVLEEFLLTDQPSMEIWPAEPDSCEAIAALLQTLYGGRLFDENGAVCLEDVSSLCAAAEWLREMMEQEMIGMAADRAQALERFVSGETAIFPDWTDEMEGQYRARLEENGVQVVALPYPSSSGDVVRVFDLVGAAAFDSGDAQKNALAVQAIAFLHEDVQAQQILGDRSVFRDEAQWLPALGVSADGAAIREQLCAVLQDILDGEEEPETAFAALQSVVDALRQTSK